jgi:hypothetical protein
MTRYQRNGWPLRGLILACALGLGACASDLANSNGSDVILHITSVQGQSENGGTAGTVASVLLSDVLFKGSVFNDNAVLSMTVLPKNPSPALINSEFEGVNLESYEVHYTRADGQNQEGVDVPFAISGAMAFFLPVTPGGTTSTDSIIVVRHQAKSEPPLSLLDGLGQGQIITTIATITVHGHTLAGQAVQATASLEIVFADFADGS